MLVLEYIAKTHIYQADLLPKNLLIMINSIHHPLRKC